MIFCWDNLFDSLESFPWDVSTMKINQELHYLFIYFFADFKIREMILNWLFCWNGCI